MPERQRPDDTPRDTSSFASVKANGTGKRRGIPQRPPTMAHIDHPPATQRVARPARGAARPVNWRRRFIVWTCVFALCALVAYAIGYAAVNLFIALNKSAGAATTATAFLQAISKQDYSSAYNTLDPAITIQIAPEDFKRQAQTTDRCYGLQTNYSEVPDSATVQGDTQTYSYSITRSKLSQPYTLRLTLDQDSQGNWKIASYGTNNDLGPGQPPCG